MRVPRGGQHAGGFGLRTFWLARFDSTLRQVGTKKKVGINTGSSYLRRVMLAEHGRLGDASFAGGARTKPIVLATPRRSGLLCGPKPAFLTAPPFVLRV